jgi:Transient receptor potential (TRP) ion channel
MGVLFFLVNCVFALVILLMCFYTSIRALMSKNPDTRYQPMRDDRGSFIKSQTNLGTTELDALGATARGDNTPYGMAERKRMDLEHENDSNASSLAVNQHANGFSRSTSPYQNPSGYSTPYQSRPTAQQFRNANNASPANNNQWQRGVGY